jgi:hypothetical protein
MGGTVAAVDSFDSLRRPPDNPRAGLISTASHDGRAASGDRAGHPPDQGGSLLPRSGESAPRARVSRLGRHHVSRWEDHHPRRHRAHDELRRAPGAGGRADPALRQDRRAGERHRRCRLRLRPGARDRARAPEHHVGEVPHALGGGASGEPASLELTPAGAEAPASTFRC